LWKRTKSRVAYDKFKALRTEVKELIERDFRRNVKVSEEQISNDPARFWSFVNTRRKLTQNPTTMYLNGEQHMGNKPIVDAFAAYFSSVFTLPTDPTNLTTANGPSSSSLCVGMRGIDSLDVAIGLRNLKPKYSSGPDGVPPYILKRMGPILVSVLALVFDQIMQSGMIPNIWKITKITPIHKKGDVTDIANYRPVAVLSSPAKVFESILYRQIFNSCQHILVDEQHGFRPGRSTITNLLCFDKFISKSLDEGTQVDVNYNDFEKAFDRVDHSVLLNKLHCIGFSPQLLYLFQDYFFNRKQYVVYGGERSVDFLATSGVPQGSNLGPLLFSLFINDIGSCISHSNYLLFADDLKIFRKVANRDDAMKLQADIDAVSEWSKVNNLPFSVKKCNMMTYTRSKQPVDFDYKMAETFLSRVNSIRDLGIIFTQDYKFSKHIRDITERAYRVLGFVLRNSRGFRSVETIVVLYQSLVRSILESGSIIWNPSENSHIVILERVQKRFLRWLYFFRYGYYPYLYPSLFVMGCLGFCSLKHRRETYYARHFFKLLNEVISNPTILSELNLFVPQAYGRCRRHLLFYPPQSRTNIYAQSAIGNAIRILNSLSHHVDFFAISYGQFIDQIEYLL
jgi:hypothetical protein